MEAPGYKPPPSRLQEFEQLGQQERRPSQIYLRTGEDPLLGWLVEKINKIIDETKADPAVFRHYYKRIKQLSEISGRIEDKEIRDKISVFAIHYLLKGAKIPLRPNDQNKFNLPFLDFSEIPTPTYYRSDASSINKIYDSLLKIKGYEFLFNQCLTGGIKSNKFMRILAGHFEFEKMKKESKADFVGILPELESKVKALINSQKVLDITPILNDVDGGPLTPDELKTRIERINQVISTYTPDQTKKVRVCGAVKLRDGQTVIVILGNDPNFKEMIDKFRKKGYRPDLSALEKSLVNQGFTEHLLAHGAEQTGISVKKPLKEHKETYSIQDVLLELNGLIGQSAEEAEGHPVYYYYSFLHSLFSTISKYERKAQDRASKEIIDQSLAIVVDKLRNHAKNTIPFDKFLKDLDLIAEEIILQLCFVETPPLKETVTQLANNRIHVSGLSRPAEGYMYTSGMNAFSQLTSALYRSESRQEKMKVGTVENIYFEVQGVFLSLLERIATKVEIKLNEPNQPLPEVIFSDLYTNNAPIPKVAALDFATMFPIERIREASRSQGKPITLVIDTSTSMFYDSKVEEIVEFYKEVINEGSLNLVFINSLAKFSMCGFDKYQGGAIIVYNNGDARFKEFNSRLSRYESREPLSPEANSFFNIFMASGDEILKYKDLINENISYVYNKLIEDYKWDAFDGNDIEVYWPKVTRVATKEEVKKPPVGLFLIKRTSDKIPNLAIHFGTFAETILKGEFATPRGRGKSAKKAAKSTLSASQAASQKASMEKRLREKIRSDLPNIKDKICPHIKNYIIAKAYDRHLPLYARQSFGFAHGTVSDNGSAIRMTVGLEEKSILDKYVGLISEISAELGKLAENDVVMDHFRLILKNDKASEYLKDLINREQKWSFEKIIEDSYAFLLSLPPPQIIKTKKK